MISRRYRRIIIFFGRILISFVLWDLFLPKIGLGKMSKGTRPDRYRRSAKAFRKLAIELGGVLIKVGQFLSSRVDVLPEEITDELAGLQDEVPAEKIEDIRRVAESELGMSLQEKFIWFDEQPLAAASLGQVHRARIDFPNNKETGPQNGSSLEPMEVVVKIQRPNIETIIATDLAALRRVGRWLELYEPIRKRADVQALLQEFTKILYEEIDYLAEGHNAETFAANFIDDSTIRVPKVIWQYTTHRVLTLENVMAIKITDYAEIEAAGIDRGEVATRLLDTYLRQIFNDGFFHADPHPGNLFVYPIPDNTSSGDDVDGNHVEWQLTFVDFGMVGRVPPTMLMGLREALIAVGTRDANRLVKSYAMLGLLLPTADLKMLEKAETKAFERFWGKNMDELRHMNRQEMDEFSSEFRDLLYDMPFQVPSDFIFLGRAIGILSGICTGLDNEFNVWEHLAPYAQKLINNEVMGDKRLWLNEITKTARILWSLPTRLDAILGKLERGEIEIQISDINRQYNRLESTIRQLVYAILFTVIFINGIQVYQAGSLVFGCVLLGIASLFLVMMIFKNK